MGSGRRGFRYISLRLLGRPYFYRPSEGLINVRTYLVYSLVDSIVDSFLYVLGRSEILPKDRLYSYCLSVYSEYVLYSSSVLTYRYVIRVF